MAKKKKTKIKLELPIPKTLSYQEIVEKGFLSQAKLNIILHPAKNKILIGAKECGKTIVPLVASIVDMDNNPYINNFAFRRAKTGAASQFIDSLVGMIQQLSMLGIETNTHFKSAQFKLYGCTNSKITMERNQKMAFGSLNNYIEDSSGIGVGNGGYFGHIILDEVIDKDGDIPNNNQWETLKEVIHSNFDRFKTQFDTVQQNNKKMTYWFIANNWAEHPITIETDKYFPENDFITWVLGEDLGELLGNQEKVLSLFNDEEWVKGLISRNSMSIYSKENDTLYTRMTKFANPLAATGDKLKYNLLRIRNALINNELTLLAIYLGSRAVPDTDEQLKVYAKHITNKINTKPIPSHFIPQTVSYGVDIDTSRVITITPIIHYRHTVNDFIRNIQYLDDKFFVDKQIEIPCYGVGEIGENNAIYVNEIIKAIENHNKKYSKITYSVFVDDNRQYYIYELNKTKAHNCKSIRLAQKHELFSIIHRQELTKLSIIKELLVFSKENTPLINDFSRTIKADINNPSRKTTGSTNYLDRIDSFEYALELFTGLLGKHLRKGV